MTLNIASDLEVRAIRRGSRLMGEGSGGQQRVVVDEERDRHRDLQVTAADSHQGLPVAMVIPTVDIAVATKMTHNCNSS